MSEGPSVAEQQMQRWLEWVNSLSPEQAAVLSRRGTRDEVVGPLEGQYGPHGGSLSRTASGRSPEEAASSGPVSPSAPGMSAAPPGVPAAGDGVPASRPERPASGLTGGPADGTTITREQVMEAVERMRAGLPVPAWAETLLAETLLARGLVVPVGQPRGPHPDQVSQDEPPVGEQALQAVRAQQALTRLLAQAPDLVRQALPSSRARSVTIWWLDNARLWFQEALREQELQREWEQDR